MGVTLGCRMGPEFGRGGTWEQLKGAQRDPNLEGGDGRTWERPKGAEWDPNLEGGEKMGGIGAA